MRLVRPESWVFAFGVAGILGFVVWCGKNPNFSRLVRRIPVVSRLVCHTKAIFSGFRHAKREKVSARHTPTEWNTEPVPCSKMEH
jgi:hypothetical protein